MPANPTRILFLGVGSPLGQPVTLTDRATGTVIGTAMPDAVAAAAYLRSIADGLTAGAFVLSLPYQLELAASAAGDAEVGAALATPGEVPGSAGGAGAGAGTLTQDLPLAGAAAGVGAGGGTESDVQHLVGEAAGQAAGAGTPTVATPGELSGAAAGQAAGGAPIIQSVPLGGSASGGATGGPSVQAQALPVVGAGAGQAAGAGTPSVAAGGGLAIPNPGFESAIGSSESTANWWPVLDQGGLRGEMAERLSSAEMTGSYVGRVYAPLVDDGEGGNLLSSAYLAAKVTKATIEAGPTLVRRFRPKAISGTAVLAVTVKDSGGNKINDETAERSGLILWRTGGSGAGYGANIDASTLAFSPSVNSTVTKSFDLKTWIEARLNAGKTWADVDSVVLRYYAVCFGDYGHTGACEFYIDD